MYYILSRKQVARRKEKSLHGKHKWEEIVVLEGSLWHTDIQEDAAVAPGPDSQAEPEAPFPLALRQHYSPSIRRSTMALSTMPLTLGH